MVYAARVRRGNRFWGVLTTLEGRVFSYLVISCLKSHENGFGCCEVGNGHGFRFQRSGTKVDKGVVHTLFLRTVKNSLGSYFGQKLSMCVACMMKREMNGLGGVRPEMARHLDSKEKG